MSVSVKQLAFAVMLVVGGAAVALAQGALPTPTENQNSPASVALDKSTQQDKLGKRPDKKRSDDRLVRPNTPLVAPSESAEKQGQPEPINMNQAN